ncbi:MAG: tetratricopeptide (TPR) repeat protein [Saprospiraceae bacterium]|jgi:tetratricopeptide (TPR) repeat protein
MIDKQTILLGYHRHGKSKKRYTHIKNAACLIFLSFSSILFAQINLDSLHILLPISKGTDKVDLLNTIAWELKFSDQDRALKLCNESIDLSSATSYTQGEAQALYQLAAFNYLKGRYPASLDISKKSITLFENINNSLGLAKNWMLNGMNLERLKDYSEALKQHEKALTTCKLFGYDKLLRKLLTNKANVYSAKGDYIKALEEYSLVSSSWLEQGDSSNYYIVLYNMARLQQELGEYTEALSNFFEIESYEKSINRTIYLANNYNEIGVLYLKLGLEKQTLEMFEKAIQLYQEIGNRRKEGMVKVNLGIYYSDNEEFEKAELFYFTEQ